MDSLIGCPEAAQARYLVIGGQAMRLHGLPRFPMDWDLNGCEVAGTGPTDR